MCFIPDFPGQAAQQWRADSVDVCNHTRVRRVLLKKNTRAELTSWDISQWEKNCFHFLLCFVSFRGLSSLFPVSCAPYVRQKHPDIDRWSEGAVKPLNCWEREQGLKRNSSDLNRFYSRSFRAGGANICRKHQAEVSNSRHYLPLCRVWHEVELGSSQCHAGYSLHTVVGAVRASHAKSYITLPKHTVFQPVQTWSSALCSSTLLLQKDSELSLHWQKTRGKEGTGKKRKVRLRMYGRETWGERR